MTASYRRPLTSTKVASVIARRLAFGAVFYLDRAASPAPDEVTSKAATGASGQQGGTAFTTTHWSVVLEAQGESPAAQEALEKLCRTYWRPIFAFLRRQGIPPEQAEGITQGFFAELLERRSLDAVRKEKGRLRSFLLGGLKYFLASQMVVGDAANGDGILTCFFGNGAGLCDNGDLHVGSTHTLIGGTGRYAGARGRYTEDRCVNQATGETSGTIVVREQ